MIGGQEEELLIAKLKNYHLSPPLNLMGKLAGPSKLDRERWMER